jgi:hypothetical protein
MEPRRGGAVAATVLWNMVSPISQELAGWRGDAGRCKTRAKGTLTEPPSIQVEPMPAPNSVT